MPETPLVGRSTDAEPTAYRGEANSTTTNSTNTIITKNTTYAAAASFNKIDEYSFPTQDEAIIIEAIENTPLKDYISAIGNIITFRAITYASRMSRNRICLFLKDSNTVDDLINKHPLIKINNTILPIRKLRSDSKRITLSEVPPFIDNETLKQCLLANKLIITSPIKLLSSYYNDPEMGHIYSFRRQTNLKSMSENGEIPDSLLIEYNDENYRIFLARDDIRCTKCNYKGHTALRCKKTAETTSISSTGPNTSQDTLMDTDTITQSPSTSTFKRPHTQSSNSEEDQRPVVDTPEIESINIAQTIETAPIVKPKRRRQHKKNKTVNNPQKAAPVPIEDMLEPLREILKVHNNKYILDFKNLKEFIKCTKGIPRTTILEMSLKFTTKTKLLHMMLHDLYQELTAKSIKQRFTIIMKCLDNEPILSDEMLSEQSATDSNGESGSESEPETTGEK